MILGLRMGARHRFLELNPWFAPTPLPHIIRGHPLLSPTTLIRRLFYKGELAGAYIADFVVDNKIILELKSVRQLTATMEAQLINYLRLSKVPVGYLINFRNTKVEWRRFIVTGE